MAFLLAKQFFILFPWKQFSFSHMACISLIPVQKNWHIFFFVHFSWGYRRHSRQYRRLWRKCGQMDFGSQSAFPCQSSEKNVSLVTQSKMLQKKADYITVLTVFCVKKKHQLESCMLTRWRMELVLTFLTLAQLKEHLWEETGRNTTAIAAGFWTRDLHFWSKRLILVLESLFGSSSLFTRDLSF